MSDEYRYTGCSINNKHGDKNECISNDCSTCKIALKHITQIIFKKNQDNIPSLHRLRNDTYYLLNMTDTIARLKTVEDAKKINNHEYHYEKVGYSLSIINKYPLFVRLKKTIGLPIPRNILWSQNDRPLIVEYDDCTYLVAPTVKTLIKNKKR